MAGMTTANMDALIRAEIWSNQLKEVLQDSLMAQQYVDWIDFGEGTQLTIPSIGELDAQDYVEDTAVEYSPLDTGEFNFTINTYLQSGTYITNKAKQDSMYAARLMAKFVPSMSRAMMVRLEQDIFKEGQPRTGSPAGYQTAGATNSINGYAHRTVGTGVLATKVVLSVEDFARNKLALQKANVPMTNLVAIVDPSTEYVMNIESNLANFDNNPRWEGIVADGINPTGLRFVKNIYGFDVYTSNYLPLCGTDQSGTSETIGGTASGANAVANLFFSATQDVLPYIGAWRQAPKVDGEYNKDLQREEFVTTSRYGTKIYRPENLVVTLSDPSAVS